MDLKQLKAMGLVTSNPLVKQDIELLYQPFKPEAEWAAPGVPERQEEFVAATVTVFLRRHTAADVVAISTTADPHERAYVAIQRSTFTEDGEYLFPTLDDARGLDLAMFAPLVATINRMNGSVKKNSRRKMNSGASSPSPSADAASPNGKTSSVPTSMTSGDSTATSTGP